MTERLLPVLREASQAILEIYADEDRFQTEVKGDQSPLTAADRRSNEIICAALADLYPGIPVISEETRQVPYAQRAGFPRFFLVDPLDGTKEFIKRNGEFTINIAYVEGQSPVGGYVYVPCSGLAYVAQRGLGAYRVQDDGRREMLKSRPFFLHDAALRVVASRSHRDPLTERMISLLLEPEIVATGSSLKFLRIAEAEADFYPRLAPTMEWDTAAAQCILEESGGSIVHFERLVPLVYNKPDLLNPNFIAMGALLDPESLAAMAEAIRT